MKKKEAPKFKYQCICGFGYDDFAKYKGHVSYWGKKEPGKHGSALQAERNILKRVQERLAQSPPPTESASEPLPQSVPAVAAATTGQALGRGMPKKAPRVPGNTGRWLKVFGGIAVALLGLIIVGGLYSMNNKSPLWFFGLPVVAGGVWLAIVGIKGGSGTTFITGDDKKALVPPDTRIAKPVGNENCLLIYPRDMGGVRFGHLDDEGVAAYAAVGGIAKKCENDGKWYYVSIWDKAKQALLPMQLPDTSYYDPREFANVYGADPIRAFFETSFLKLEKLAPWIFLAMIGIFLLALIILPGALKGNG